MNPLINVEHVQKEIDDFKFGPVDLTIQPGTITVIVGNNGSGKSTLFKMIMNLVNVDKGDITVFNKRVNGKNESWKTDISYQPQTQVGYDAFTGNQLKELISQWYPHWNNDLFKQLIELFDVPLTKRYGKLSQGAQQKLLLALTIARQTSLLLLDEPTSFLDIPSKKILIDILIDWMDQDERSILFASHQADEIKRIADYIVILRDGKIVGHYEKEQLIESYKRFWLNDSLPNSPIPGEVSRELTSFVSAHPEQSERFLKENEKTIMKITSVDLEEIISFMLKRD